MGQGRTPTPEGLLLHQAASPTQPTPPLGGAVGTLGQVAQNQTNPPTSHRPTHPPTHSSSTHLKQRSASRTPFTNSTCKSFANKASGGQCKKRSILENYHGVAFEQKLNPPSLGFHLLSTTLKNFPRQPKPPPTCPTRAFPSSKKPGLLLNIFVHQPVLGGHQRKPNRETGCLDLQTKHEQEKARKEILAAGTKDQSRKTRLSRNRHFKRPIAISNSGLPTIRCPLGVQPPSQPLPAVWCA